MVVHFFAAVLIPNFFSSDFSHIFPQRTPTAIVYREYAISGVVALALGYFVFYKWRSSTAKWIWVVGALWFAWEAVSIWQGQAHPYSVLTVQARPSLLSVALHMLRSLQPLRQAMSALMLVRTLFYSIGAWVCWFSIKDGGAPFASLRHSLRSLR